MTTVSEPDLDELRASVAELEGRASEEAEDASNKGTKRKRAPHTKGPCEHGVKYRSQCKVCSACPHGKSAQSMQGVRWVCNLRARSSALSVQGVRWVSNLRARSSAL